MTIDRHKLQGIIRAMKAGEALDDEQRTYAVRLLTMVNQLAFGGDDLERRYEYQQRKGSERIQHNVNDMTLLGIAHRTGRGMDEARRFIQAKREGVHKTKAAVDLVKAVSGITTNAAINEVATILGRDPESVHTQYYRKAKATTPKPEGKG